MKKLILAFLTLVAVMALCLTSCEGDKTPDKDETPEPHTHTPSEWITDTEATCKVEGTKHKECTECEEVLETGSIDKLAHTPSEWITDTEATCKTEGTKHKECTECEEVLETGKVDKLEHNYSTEFVFNATHHYYECTCGLRSNEATHISSGAPTSHNDEVCTVCGYVINEAVGIKFNTLNVNGNKVNGKVSNDTEYYTFIGEITTVGGATYIISDNISGKDPIVAQTIDLVTGDNTVYVIEFIDGEPTNIYIVTIRRRPMYDVTFNTVGGTAVECVTVEEDTILTAPQTTRAGYTFAGWDYDFTQPITQSFTATASWTAHTDTKYVVEYYLENVEKTGYDILDSETETLKGTTGTTVNAEQKTFDHFTLNTQKSTLSGNIDGEGKLVLKVYYTRDAYTVSTDRNNTKGGTVTSGGTYAYDKEITLTASTNAGYTFLGWFEGETKVSDSRSYTFNVDHSTTYTAKWDANEKTKYVVEYYLENLTKTDYDLNHTDTLYDVTDTTATAEIKSITHFTYNKGKSEISGNIDGNGTLVLKVYYTRDMYTVSVVSDDATVTGTGTYPYGTDVNITVSGVRLGYLYNGMYSGETLVTENPNYKFKINKTIEIKIKVELDPQMLPFNFTSNASTCTITGIKDKTVTEIIVPDYVTSISQGAFSGCSKLTSITIPFVGGSKSATTASSSTLFGYIFGTSSYTGGVSTTQYYNSSSSATYYISSSLESVTVTGGNILYGAFRNCTSLTSVVILDSVTSIGWGAFSACSSLESITLPFIGATKDGTSNTHFGYIFGASEYSDNNDYVPSSLKTVIIGDSVTSIGEEAFAHCYSLTSVSIGGSVTSIGYAAFWACDSLTSVVIPDSVTSIGGSAFYGCDSLTSVKYRGTEDQWSAISKGHRWNYIFGNYTITYNYDGE